MNPYYEIVSVKDELPEEGHHYHTNLGIFEFSNKQWIDDNDNLRSPLHWLKPIEPKQSESVELKQIIINSIDHRNLISLDRENFQSFNANDIEKIAEDLTYKIANWQRLQEQGEMSEILKSLSEIVDLWTELSKVLIPVKDEKAYLKAKKILDKYNKP